MEITEVARRSGVPASTLRFYEEKGTDRLHGQAGPSACCFSLDEIALMFAPDGRLRIDRRMLRAKAEELDRTIRQLTEMRDGLRHAAACRAPSHMECPTFSRILRAAASGAIGPRGKRSLAGTRLMRVKRHKIKS
jgi:hypothetical protein